MTTINRLIDEVHENSLQGKTLSRQRGGARSPLQESHIRQQESRCLAKVANAEKRARQVLDFQLSEANRV